MDLDALVQGVYIYIYCVVSGQFLTFEDLTLFGFFFFKDMSVNDGLVCPLCFNLNFGLHILYLKYTWPLFILSVKGFFFLSVELVKSRTLFLHNHCVISDNDLGFCFQELIDSWLIKE